MSDWTPEQIREASAYFAEELGASNESDDWDEYPDHWMMWWDAPHRTDSRWIDFTIEDPRCREVVRDHYRKRGWSAHLHALNLGVTYLPNRGGAYQEPTEFDCLMAIFLQENNK